MKKLLHLADLHLGARLHDRDRLPEQRLLLGWLCDLMARERPDAVLLAGDLFDVYYPPASVQEVWFGFLARIRREALAGHVVAIAGNHDSPTALGSPGRVLDLIGVSLLAGDTAPEEEVRRIPSPDGGALVVAAIPFQREGALRTQGEGDASLGFVRHVSSSLAAARALDPGAPVIAVAHCTLSGAEVSDDVSERGRRSIGGVKAVPATAFEGADYVALGHLHLPQCVGGHESIRYAGAPLPMSFDEASSARPKSVAIVEFDGGPGTAPRIREEPVPSFRELRAFTGSREQILQDIQSWSPTTLAAGGAWASLSVTEGDGAFSDLCAAARAALGEKGVELVCNTDDRHRAPSRAGADALSIADIQALDPMAIAKERLAEPDLHLSPAERDAYLALLRDVMGDADDSRSTLPV